MTHKDQVQKRAIEMLAAEPNGLRFSELKRRLITDLTSIPPNTVHGNIWNLETRVPDKVLKPAKGLFLHTKYQQPVAALVATVAAVPSSVGSKKIREEDFYQPFATWLVDDLEECTRAVAVGGNKLKDKWGTPDVVGVLEPRKSDIIKFPTEIVSAEIKLDSNQLIVAFGQACAYKLFSHRSHLVVPATSTAEDLARLDALCMVFGIGLVLFDASKPADPDFSVRVRALRHEPDSFYANQSLKLLEDDLF